MLDDKPEFYSYHYPSFISQESKQRVSELTSPRKTTGPSENLDQRDDIALLMNPMGK